MGSIEGTLGILCNYNQINAVLEMEGSFFPISVGGSVVVLVPRHCFCCPP